MTNQNNTAAAKRTKVSSVPGEESVCAASAFVIPVTLAKCGGNTVNAMTTPVCGTRAKYAQGTGSVIAVIVSVNPTGLEIIVTAPHAQTPVCPAVGSCAVVGGSASVASVTAPSQAPTGTPVKNAPPVLTPAPLRRGVWSARSLSVALGRMNPCAREFVEMRLYV